MKLAKVKVEYTSGLTLIDRVVVNVETGDVLLPPRLIDVMAKVDETECSPAFSLDYKGRVVAVQRNAAGKFSVTIPDEPAGNALQRFKHSLSFPTENQRQQNVRYLHTLSASALGGAVVLWHSVTSWDIGSIGNLASLLLIAVILWVVGFRGMNGEN